MRPTVLLFDIDGTLLTTGGAGRRAMERAFEALHGRPGALCFRLDGMTDGVIVREGLKALGVPPDPGPVGDLLSSYLSLLEEEVARADAAAYRLHSGVRRAVEAGLSMAGVAVGLGTGNVREGARIKLQRVDLFSCFRFGGFGCDHDDRAELIRRGAERGAEALGAPLSECRVVVVGDTPKDIAAARANGAESIGVGTGHFRPDQLLAAGATCAFEDLDSSSALRALLGQDC